MVRRGKELGLEVALADVLPWNNGHPLADEPIAELNRLIAGSAASEDVPVLRLSRRARGPGRAAG